MHLVSVGMSLFGELDCPGMSPGAPAVPLSVSPAGSKYYEKEALLADPVFGPILASLLGEPESRVAYTGPVGAEGQVLKGPSPSRLSLSPQWDPVLWSIPSSRQPITTGPTLLLMSWSRGTVSGVPLIARTPQQNAQP